MTHQGYLSLRLRFNCDLNKIYFLGLAGDLDGELDGDLVEGIV